MLSQSIVHTYDEKRNVRDDVDDGSTAAFQNDSKKSFGHLSFTVQLMTAFVLEAVFFSELAMHHDANAAPRIRPFLAYDTAVYKYRLSITMMMSCCRLLLVALLLLIHGRATTAFSFSNPNTLQRGDIQTHKRTVELQMTTTSNNDNNNDDSLHRVDVVVFGVGDLRVDDHGGLKEALRQSSNHVQPVVLLDPSMLQCIPGATCFTYDTACMLHYALVDLEASLHAQLGLELQVVSSIDEMYAMFDNNDTSNVHVHVCDLGPADNAMGYGPYSVLSQTLEEKVEIHAWTCRLREEPWKQLETLTDLYPTYEQVFVHKEDAQFPTKIIKQHAPQRTNRPWQVAFHPLTFLCNKCHMNDQNKKMDVKSQANTGLYGTHWGGLDPATVGESSVWKLVQEYTDVYGENGCGMDYCT